MNKQDLNTLTDHWHSETNSLNTKIDEAFKQAQDHAYELGLKRGQAEGKEIRDELLTALRIAEGSVGDLDALNAVKAAIAKVTGAGS